MDETSKALHQLDASGLRQTGSSKEGSEAEFLNHLTPGDLILSGRRNPVSALIDFADSRISRERHGTLDLGDRPAGQEVT